MIDLHCHLLPGIDDGPQTIEQAVELSCASFERGVTTAVATPHFSHGYPTEVDAIEEAAEALRRGLNSAGCGLELLTGCEIAMSSLGALDEGDLRDRTLGHGNCLLIEPPFRDVPENLEFVVNDLQVSGFQVLIAHPERSAGLAMRRDLLERAVKRGAKCSVTAGSLNGKYGSAVREVALEMCEAGLIHNIASDTHDLGPRSPGLELTTAWPAGLPDADELDAIAADLIGLSA